MSALAPIPGGRLLPLVALAAALTVFAALELTGLRLAGAFEYPLDDPYIHLALAEQIARGGYGVNPGELSSPGSSPAYPLLLLPFVGTGLHRFLPLVWGAAGLTALAWLWGRLLAEAGYGARAWRGLGLAAAGLGPFAVMMPHVATLGMEHSLHAAASLALLLGLARHMAGRGGTTLVACAAFAASAMRFEALALGLIAASVLALTGARRAGLVTALATLAPIVAFVVLLSALGLDPLPSSVQAKIADGSAAGMGPIAGRLIAAWASLGKPVGMLLAGLILALVALWRLAPAIRDSHWRWLALGIAAAGAAHLLAGQIGWLNRYEHYILVTLAAAVLVLLPRARAGAAPGLAGGLGVAAVLAAGFIAYQPGATLRLPYGPLAIHAQQGEMARFVKDFLRTPVAVNDIGLVSWQNPRPVLDLWGLASAEARAARLAPVPTPGWAGALVARHGVPAALVYDHWIDEGLGPDWTRMGELIFTRRVGFLGGPSVTFYATDPAAVAPMRAAIAAWAPGLGADAQWRWAEGMAP